MRDGVLTFEEAISYDSETGKFTWKVSPSQSVSAGQEAGSLHHTGYVHIKLNGKLYAAHQVAFRLMTGEWPPYDVHHMNGVKSDNRWCNLFAVTRSKHCHYRKRRGRYLKGVQFNGSRWAAAIWPNGNYMNLGTFDTEEEAHAAYCKAAKEIYGVEQ